MAKIIISAPHALCRSESDKILHFCDVIAGPVAQELNKRLKVAGHEVMLHLGDINREENDLNRSTSRDTDFRKKLAADFPKADCLLDCHSTPRSRITWDEDLVILKWQTNSVNNLKYTHALAAQLINQDLDTSITYACAQDDIIDHALTSGLPAILVEFSELSFANNPDQLMERFVVGFNQFIENLPKLGKPASSAVISESLDRLADLLNG